MDGNGRWAQARGLPRLAGHRAGTENLRRILQACADFGIEVLTVYAFSTENWARPEEEVKGLMALLMQYVRHELDNLDRNGVQIRHSGKVEGISPDILHEIERAVERTRHNSKIILNVAFNYGGRAEIVEATRRMIRDGVKPDEVTDALFERYLYTAGLPDPDLIIRTAGEMRLSNFLLWQAAYAEYYSSPVYWPDFNEAELYKALAEYARRERKFGRVPPAGGGIAGDTQATAAPGAEASG
ncbi:MAG: di-trans,poly-cis-decaprenylcistransferase [Chloroflexi bacterium]|nr:di-trans,poly-cis-decaprenylcistransferase [Chloroflexota bacterium]